MFGGCGGDLLGNPARHDQTEGYRQSLGKPDARQAEKHAQYVRASEKDVKSKKDIAVQHDVERILPAEVGEKMGQSRHRNLIDDTETQGFEDIAFLVGYLDPPGTLIRIAQLN